MGMVVAEKLWGSNLLEIYRMCLKNATVWFLDRLLLGAFHVQIFSSDPAATDGRRTVISARSQVLNT